MAVNNIPYYLSLTAFHRFMNGKPYLAKPITDDAVQMLIDLERNR